MTLSVPDQLQNYERKIYEQRQLIEISRALNSTLDYEYLVQAIVDVCMAHVQTMQTALLLAPDFDASHIALVEGYKGFDLHKPREKYKISLESPLILFLSVNNKSLTLSEAEKAIENNTSLDLFREIGVELIVPFSSKGKVNGLIMLGEKVVSRDYSISERNFLVDLATLGGIAVENARLYEQATIDMMTGLKNHAYFQTKTREEREKAKKRNSPLSLIMTDIDHFKNFNDTYGHQAGDEVLKAVADKLIECTRKSDFAARYGGEEFCLVLPGTELKAAVDIAERLRKSIECLSVEYEGRSMKVTMSAGVTAFDSVLDKSNRSLIERADKALYAAKRGGRNKIECYRKDLEQTDNIITDRK